MIAVRVRPRICVLTRNDTRNTKSDSNIQKLNASIGKIINSLLALQPATCGNVLLPAVAAATD